MNEKITSTNIKAFLKDHLENSEIILLEEGKEKNDIMDVAKAKGYILKDSTDLAGFKTIFTFANKANANNARLPKEKLLKALPGIIGKPVDIDHIRNYVVGHYIDYRYVAKEDMVVAYGVFYKSNFGEEWAKAQELFKAKKLGTSYEVWCPKNKRKTLPDGTYELTSIEIAGGGLMFKEKPAFADALVLEVAKKTIENQHEEMVFASEKKSYDSTEILTSADQVVGQPVSTQLPAGEKVADAVVSPAPQVVANNMVKCSNCSKSFEDIGDAASKNEVKCPECFAILDKSGQMKYPPQIINFSLRCPGCSSSNWKLLKDSPETASLKCMSCAKNYKVDFAKANLDPLLTKIAFVYMGSVSCHQCGSNIPFSTINKAATKNLACTKCGLKFAVDVTKMDKNRSISNVNQVMEDNTMHVSSEKGGQKSMSQTPEEQPKVETPVVEVAPVAEVKVEAPVVEAPKAEEVKPAEAVVEAPKVEETPKAEEILEVEDAEVIEQEEVLEVAKTLKAEDRTALKDEDFAVVKTVKDKKGEKTLRKYPIHDKAHVQNALSRLHQAPGRDGLKKLGVDVKTTIDKVKAKGKTLGMEEAEMEPYCQDTSMQPATPRGKDDVQKANEHVSGLNPDQVNQMQNQLLSYKKAWKKMKKAHKAMKMSSAEKPAGSDTDVDPATPTDIKLAEDLAKGKPVVAPAAPVMNVSGEESSDTDVKPVAKDADTLAKELADAKPVEAPAAPVENMEIASIRAEVTTIKQENETLKEKIQILETAAVKLLERKNVLGEDGKSLSDKDILDDDKFEMAKLAKENAKLKLELEKSSSHVGEISHRRNETELQSKRREIDEKAFGKNKK